MGFGDPNMPRLRQTLRDIAVEAGNLKSLATNYPPQYECSMVQWKGRILQVVFDVGSLHYQLSICFAGQERLHEKNVYDPNTHLSFGDLQADDQ